MTGPLWRPGDPLLDSTEVYALDDITPPPPLLTDPWAPPTQEMP